MRVTCLILFLIPYTVTILAQNTNATLQLQIIGNNSEETEIIKKQGYKDKFEERIAIENEIDSLHENLLNLGYFDTTRKVQKKTDSTFLAVFSLGNQYQKLKLFVSDNNTIKDYIKETGFEVYRDTVEIETAFAKALLKQLSIIASNNGNPFATFQITNLSKKNNTTLVAELETTLKKKRNITKTIVKGYDDISKSHLRQYTKQLNNLPYSQTKITRLSREIASLPFLRQSKNPEALFKKDSTVVFLYLEKQNVNRFDGFLGFTTNDRNKLRLDGYLNLQLTNNLNYGESLTFNYKADGNDQSQLKISTRLPYLFKSPIGIEASLALFRKDSTFSTTKKDIELFYQLNRNNTTSIGYSSNRSEDLRETTSSPTNSINTFNASTIIASNTYSIFTRNLFSPIKTNIHIEINVGSRKIENQQIDQSQILIDGSHILKLNPKNSLYIRNTTQYLNSRNYLTNELYRLGGITSIRGFEENSLFANLYSVLNTEYRYQVNNTLLLNSIIDLGYLENEVIKEKNTLYSAGIGASIRTKAGILKINLANGKFKNRDFKFSNTKLHLILAVSF